ncbi:MAG: hypothetical protein GWN72_24505 [Nitrospinaceae bacterium]|nr:hypothetical protein [Nitrospinaceae bacterium]
MRWWIPLLLCVWGLEKTSPVYAHRLDIREPYSLNYYQEQTLFGDWNGARSSLRITVESIWIWNILAIS